ncbi:MAG: EAL domain-containing protein [Bacillota bacterium]
MQANHIAENVFEYSITHWFQPIYQLFDNKILGYEALLRDASKIQISPVEIFKNAERDGYRNSLDMISMRAAMNTIEDDVNQLFLNVFPSTLLKQDFLSWWDIHVSPDIPIVLELLENEPVIKWGELKAVTKELRTRGVKIAIDDMGMGYSFFQQWIELEPDYIKLDRYFAENLSTNTKKQKAVKSLINLMSESTEIIIEGIETVEDLGFAELLGISYAQGYLLGRPSPAENIIPIQKGRKK